MHRVQKIITAHFTKGVLLWISICLTISMKLLWLVPLLWYNCFQTLVISDKFSDSSNHFLKCLSPGDSSYHYQEFTWNFKTLVVQPSVRCHYHCRFQWFSQFWHDLTVRHWTYHGQLWLQLCNIHSSSLISWICLFFVNFGKLCSDCALEWNWEYV